MEKSYVIGVDFGTDSVRSILVDAQDGEVLSTAIFAYPRWKQGKFCDPGKNQFRQDPRDHLEGLESTVKQVVKEADVAIHLIKGIGVDTTGSSPLAITEDGFPLSFLGEFEENPNAQVILWKDHTAIEEALEITEVSRNWGGVDFTSFSGGIYSSEWFWAKILKIYRTDPKIESMHPNWIEHCDYITGELTGKLNRKVLKRSRCAAGHKAMWNETWGGFPDKEYLTRLRPSLGILREKLSDDTFTSIKSLGPLSPKWVEKLGLNAETKVAVGTIDAHAGAVGAGIQKGTMVKVMGTSTCDLLVSSLDSEHQQLIKGISGQVTESIVPEMIGYEAGQAGFGDLLAWFKKLITQPTIELIQRSNSFSEEIKKQLIEEIEEKSWDLLTQKAKETLINEGHRQELALDWINGRRSPDVNESLKAAITGIGMGTGVGDLYRCLVESLCFGSKSIIERFIEQGVHIEEVVAVGGIAKKSPYLVQTMADILELPIKVVNSDQTPALGAAIYAAVAAGIYPDFEQASQSISSDVGNYYAPDIKTKGIYRKLFKKYKILGNITELKL